MDTHCAIEKNKNLLSHVHNKIHQPNINSFNENDNENQNEKAPLARGMPLFVPAHG